MQGMLRVRVVPQEPVWYDWTQADEWPDSSEIFIKLVSEVEYWLQMGSGVIAIGHYNQLAQRIVKQLVLKFHLVPAKEPETAEAVSTEESK